jgi:hypothetical protein
VEQNALEGAEQNKPEAAEQNKLEGLGGWLMLVALGIILAPLRIAAETFPIYSEVFSSGAWAAITTPGTEDYVPYLASYVYAEGVINVGMIMAWVYIGFLFFTRKKAFPQWFIGILLFTLAFIVVDALWSTFVLPGEPVFDADTTKQLVRSLIYTAIWMPYMLVSERVKLTFVR